MFTTLNRNTLGMACEFYGVVKNDTYFTHFRHTHPNEMLENWEVYIFIEDDVIKSWGQVQLFDGNKSHIARLGFCVHPAYRKNGHGTAMLNHALLKCKQEKLTASTRLDNLPMLNIFLKAGFIIEGCFVNEEKINGKPISIVSLARFQ